MQLLKVKTHKGHFFYIDGKRVNEMRYLDALEAGIRKGSYNSAQTKITMDKRTGNETFRSYCCV